MKQKSTVSANLAENRIITFEDVHEISMAPGSIHPLSGKGAGLIILTPKDVSADVWDFLGTMVTGHAGSLASPPNSALDGLKRLNVILRGKTGKGKTSRYKGGKYGR